jgi:hypothetical protein
MIVHDVRQGDYMASIAMQYGFSDWRQIYDHADNAALKKRRPNPNVLLPGDQVCIPDKPVKQVDAAPGAMHKFEVQPMKPIRLQIALKDEKGKALAGLPYTLTVNHVATPGKTSGEGVADEEIPVGTRTATLVLDGRGIRWDIDIGHLDPIHEDDDTPIVSGIQARLNNLGFSCGAVDGVLGSRTEQALRQFQRDVMGRETPDGQPDKETRDKLLERHGA